MAARKEESQVKTRTKKIIVRVTGVAVPLLVLVFFVMWEMAFRTLLGMPDDVAGGWTDRMRQQASPPAALATFLTDERTDGNAAEWVYRYREEADDNQSYARALRFLQRNEALEAAERIGILKTLSECGTLLERLERGETLPLQN